MLYAIGDVHGQHQALTLLLDTIQTRLNANDTIVFVGDYIDRGPASSKVVETIVSLVDQNSIITLKGNHEELALEARARFRPRYDIGGLILAEEDPARIWFSQGGQETLLSYGLDLLEAPDDDIARWVDYIPDEHWRFLDSTATEYITDKFHFVHAGLLPPGEQVWEYDGYGIDPRLWIREPFLSFGGDFGGKRVVFGHTPQVSGLPLVENNKIGIDTGAGYDGPLTCAVLDENGEIRGFLQATAESIEALSGGGHRS